MRFFWGEKKTSYSKRKKVNSIFKKILKKEVAVMPKGQRWA
jgi:hypothetical protein